MLRIVHTGRKDLHGNITVEVLVAGAIDIFHTTSADRLGVCFSDLRLALHQDLLTGIPFFFHLGEVERNMAVQPELGFRVRPHQDPAVTGAIHDW